MIDVYGASIQKTYTPDLQLVSLLVDQFEGEIELKKHKGTDLFQSNTPLACCGDGILPR